MKVNGNDPTFYPADPEIRNLTSSASNIPIRLEIASRIMAGNLGWYVERVERSSAIVSYSHGDIAIDALIAADALIKAHNDTCGGEG